MNDESARQGALPNHQTQPHRSPLAGRAVAHLKDGYTYSGWVEVGGGVVTIDGRLRTKTGPSHSRTYIHRGAVKRTYPVGALRRIDWTESAG
jgi:hypothetical protein